MHFDNDINKLIKEHESYDPIYDNRYVDGEDKNTIDEIIYEEKYGRKPKV